MPCRPPLFQGFPPRGAALPFAPARAFRKRNADPEPTGGALDQPFQSTFETFCEQQQATISEEQLDCLGAVCECESRRRTGTADRVRISTPPADRRKDHHVYREDHPE
jgi:hypothetical protein